MKNDTIGRLCQSPMIPEEYIQNNKIKAVLCTCSNERIVEREEIELPANYNGDQYGDTVPFCVGSNQYIELQD